MEPYAPRYRIFNLCPVYENSYDAEAFSQGNLDDELKAEEAILGGPVERYPWPDHHPPPLSLMRVMVEGAKKWYLQDDRNVIVIHCKVRSLVVAPAARHCDLLTAGFPHSCVGGKGKVRSRWSILHERARHSLTSCS